MAWAQATPPSSSATGAAAQAAPAQGAQPQVPQPQAAQAQAAQQGSPTANGTAGTVPQTGAPAAASAQNNISGCLQHGFANFQISDKTTNTTYQLHDGGVNLSKFENHVVTVQGVSDPKAGAAGEVVFYAQQVKDSGQSCAPSGQMVAANTPETGSTGNNGTSVNATTTGAGGNTVSATTTPEQSQTQGAIASNQAVGQSAQAGAPPDANSAGQSPAEASANADAARQSDVGAPSGTLGVDNKVPANAQSQSGQQAGGMENKGTHQAGTPESATAAGSSSASQSAGKTFQGCVSGEINNLTLAANGNTYRIQGKTAQMNQLVGHQVEITGDEVNGKAIDVKSVRDMGSSCSKK